MYIFEFWVMLFVNFFSVHFSKLIIYMWNWVRGRVTRCVGNLAIYKYIRNRTKSVVIKVVYIWNGNNINNMMRTLIYTIFLITHSLHPSKYQIFWFLCEGFFLNNFRIKSYAYKFESIRSDQMCGKSSNMYIYKKLNQKCGKSNMKSTKMSGSYLIIFFSMLWNMSGIQHF